MPLPELSVMRTPLPELSPAVGERLRVIRPYTQCRPRRIITRHTYRNMRIQLPEYPNSEYLNT